MMQLSDKVAPGHTALVVIDIQRDFAAPDGCLARMGRDLSMVEPMLDLLEETIRSAKAAGIPVLYAKQVYDRTKLNALQLEQYDLDGKMVTCDIATSGHEYYRIQPDPGLLFVKHDFNVFSNPAFKSYLEEHGIKTLVITGMDTIYCVETAVRTAFDLGYKVVLPEDLVACNASNMDLHNRTIQLTRKVFGTVVTSEELRAVWQ